MQYITLDTNTWIYLANGFESVKILNYIEREMNNGTITLLVPELVIIEFNRNKDNAVKQTALKHYKEADDSLNKIIRLLGDEPKKSNYDLMQRSDNDPEHDDFAVIIKKLKNNRKSIENAIEENIILVDNLFHHGKCIVIKETNKVLLKSSRFALEKKAPFLKKNSFADAVILFSFIDYVTTNFIEGAFFITYNTEDFCESKNGKKSLHPDLKPEFINSKSRFYHTVGEAINAIESDILTEEEIDIAQQLIEEEFFKPDEEEGRATNAIYCINCEQVDNRLVELRFDWVADINNERISFSKNQLSFDFAVGLPITDAFSTKVSLSFCDECNTEHFKCVNCNFTNDIRDEDYNKRIECLKCKLTYYIPSANSYDYDGNGDDGFYRIIKKSETCIICNTQYENDGHKDRICPLCADILT